MRPWLNGRAGEAGAVKHMQQPGLAGKQRDCGEDARQRYMCFLWPEAAAEPPAEPPVRIIFPPEHPGPWLLTPVLARKLEDYLPASLSFQEWNCIFAPGLHGVCLQTLYRRFERSPGPSILLVRDSNGRLFGGFASEAWRSAGRHYGSGECFVFAVGDAGQETEAKLGLDLRVYSWSGLQHFYMFSDTSTLAMGEGGRSAISIAGDFLHGSSLACDTFASPVLASQPDFVIEAIEFWGFDCPGAAEL